MSKWLNLLHEIEKGENGGFEPMSVLSVDNSGVYKKINTQDRLIKNSSVSANVSLSVCPKTPFFNFNFNKKNILKSPQQRTDKTDIGGFPKFFEKENNLSFEDIVVDVTRYRSVLEQTYIDADHDDWHRDGMPQKFRASDHTYDEMKIALARFIQRVHGHEAEVVAAVIAFEKIQETLLEHRNYLNQQKLCLTHKTPQSKKDCELAWQDCMRAYKKLPEYKVLMSAKKRQCLFDPLMDKQPSKEHIQDLVNSLATS
jgi:hypothetical protein